MTALRTVADEVAGSSLTSLSAVVSIGRRNTLPCSDLEEDVGYEAKSEDLLLGS